MKKERNKGNETINRKNELDITQLRSLILTCQHQPCFHHGLSLPSEWMKM